MKQDDESHKMIASPHRDETLGHSDKESESQFPLKVRRSFRTRITDWYSGWRFTLALASFASVIVLAFNLGFVIWAAVHRKVEGNRGTLHEGNCEKVQHMSTGLHFAINILSTSLLGASNYCMVRWGLISSPCTTWKDIDRAHGKGRWVDIGVPSIRNLRQVSKRRAVLYNSTIFAITSANSYRVFIGPEGFDKLDVQNITLHDGDPASDVLLRLHAEAQNGTLQRLDISQCVNAYATDFQTSYGSLIVVTNDTDQAVQYHSVQHQATFMPVENLGAKASDPYQWICSSQRQAKDRTCGQLLSDVKDQVSKNNWYVYGYQVGYCLAERPPQRCKLEYSLPLAIIVVVFNLVKAIIIGYTAANVTTKPILTTGDAVASFIQRPDDFTRGHCLLTSESVKKRTHRPSYKSSTFNSTPKRWHAAVSSKRYLLGLVSYTLTIAIVISLCVFGVSTIRDKSSTWTMGLGAVNAQTLITGTNWVTSLISNALIANTPQLLFSMIYFTFNAIFTAMTLAAEWSRYANHRKGLRVSGTPENAQRSSYFLSFPYRFAVPALAFSAILHWLISQSLFLVGIESYTEKLQRDPTRDVMTCGYSPPAMASAIVVGTVMMAWLVGFSFRRLESGMPVAGSCSLAIAAACHPTLSLKGGEYVEEEGKWGVEQMKVQWGVTYVDSDGEGHCSFSSGEVGVPEDGKVYR
ncbi:hypothetical protein BDV37DRAFT_292944 [Aspergillus pseudonomiae]|uniref:DUF6536 domain-containing protein n=1 Tax=Aspergillus pseudonomiae TaxID=1506151 RepID=A0A5N7DH57_9EURO|nr:uncharacterized protein BDV37DRAFT_292944 [Aspergillus pseudonomiae]KAE8405751.1 hypothetical protein BDV37DRAFT_292944 [Aspergillus pseudonomiae]